MSQELIGGCGAIVGSGEYFQRINQNAIFAPFLPSSSGYQYSTAIEHLCAQCAAVIDEIYADMRNSKSVLSKISDSQKENLLALIGNLEEAAGFFFPAFTCASGCRDMLEHCDSGDEEEILSIWSDDIGSDGYLQSKCSPIFKSIFSDPLSNISQRIRQDLYNIAGQIIADVDLGLNMHHYVRDENGEALRGAVNELGRCGCENVSFYASKIQTLCWYREISSNNVLALQKALNKTSGSATLTEDGVYGEKTSNAWNNFMDILAHGSFPSLTIINPLQTDLTGIKIDTILKQKKKTPGLIQNLPGSKLPDTYWQTFLFDTNKTGNQSLFYFDAPHLHHNYYHWNYHPDGQTLIPLDDHVAITEDAFLKVGAFGHGAKVVKIAGRILLVAGAVLDAIEIGTTMYDDLNDADGKLGRSTITTAASIAGEWGGSIAGAKIGAMAGAALGSAILPGPGTLVGGAVIGLAGGIAGSIAGDSFGNWIAEYILDITGVGE